MVAIVVTVGPWNGLVVIVIAAEATRKKQRREYGHQNYGEQMTVLFHNLIRVFIVNISF